MFSRREKYSAGIDKPGSSNALGFYHERKDEARADRPVDHPDIGDQDGDDQDRTLIAM
jgi:hypothetical protein